MNKDDIYTDKPPSQIYPEKTPEKVSYTLEEIDTHTADFWKKIDQKYYYQYKKGEVLCPSRVELDGDNTEMLRGFVKVTFQYIRDDIHDKESNLEKRQEQLVKLSIVESTVLQSVQLLTLFNFKLDVKSITSIMHGYINEYVKQTTNR